MTLRQRTPRIHDKAHLAFVRAQECCIPFCKRQAEAAHLRMANPSIGKRETGGGERPSDCYVVPLCPYHHRTGIDCQHNSNEKTWWELRGIDPWKIAVALWIQSGGAEREAGRIANPKPIKPRRIKARKPAEQRAKIRSRSDWPAGRKLQGRGFQERRP